MTALLNIQQLQLDFYKKPILKNIDITINPGDRVALVGESGSGKSVTAQAIMGLHDKNYTDISGSIMFENQALLNNSPQDWRKLRGKEIAMIFQDPMNSLNPLQTIGQQIIETLELHQGLSKQQALEEAIKLLEMVEMPDVKRRVNYYPHMLSGGQKQRVMIAIAISCQPKLLLADEPTTALDVTIQAQIISLLLKLQQELNMAILLITHDLALVKKFANIIYVMQKGEIVEHKPTELLFKQPEHPYTQQLLQSFNLPSPQPFIGENMLLKAENITCQFVLDNNWFKAKSYLKAVEDISLLLYQGETLGIVGESGSGKSTLALALLQLQAHQGQVYFDNKILENLKNKDLYKLRSHLQIVFQDPFASLSPRLNIEQILAEGLHIHAPELNRAQKQGKMIAVLQEVGLEANMLNRYPHEFSGGQRQRIAIARVLLLQPKLIILDEPTSALDASVQAQIVKLLRELQEKYQMSYILISHDLRIIRAMAHRIIVMKQGKVVEENHTEMLFSDPKQEYTKTLLQAVFKP